MIHFGADGNAQHKGTLWLVNNTIVTPFVSPVVDLSTTDVKARLINNIIWNGQGEQEQQELVALPTSFAKGKAGVPAVRFVPIVPSEAAGDEDENLGRAPVR